jgi:GDP-L-fucose synthase
MGGMKTTDKIYVAGHDGLVGSGIMRRLRKGGYDRLCHRTIAEMDLCEQGLVREFFEQEKPDCVILAAARVGGIQANDAFPADFLRDNLQIQTNVIDAAHRSGVHKLLFLGSSCIYPKFAKQPIDEDELLTSKLEETNEWYAIAKIAGIKLCQALRRQHGFDAISVMPTNLYGPVDNFHPENSHVLPALMRKCHEAKDQGLDTVVVWGTGTVRREFLHVDDLADAVVLLMERYSSAQFVNIGVGEDLTILELARLIAEVVGFEGELVLDPSKPDGTPQKLLNLDRVHAEGWKARIGLREGIASTYEWFLEHQDDYRR